MRKQTEEHGSKPENTAKHKSVDRGLEECGSGVLKEGFRPVLFCRFQRVEQLGGFHQSSGHRGLDLLEKQNTVRTQNLVSKKCICCTLGYQHLLTVLSRHINIDFGNQILAEIYTFGATLADIRTQHRPL